MKSVKTLRMTRLSRSRGGAGNKYTFCKLSQIVFSQAFSSAKCMYFRKLSQIFFRKNTWVSQAFANMILHAFASFHANSQMRFRSVSQYFASFRNLWFRKVWQGFANGLSRAFTKDSQVRKSWFFTSNHCNESTKSFENRGCKATDRLKTCACKLSSILCDFRILSSLAQEDLMKHVNKLLGTNVIMQYRSPLKQPWNSADHRKHFDVATHETRRMDQRAR